MCERTILPTAYISASHFFAMSPVFQAACRTNDDAQVFITSSFWCAKVMVITDSSGVAQWVHSLGFVLVFAASTVGGWDCEGGASFQLRSLRLAVKQPLPQARVFPHLIANKGQNMRRRCLSDRLAAEAEEHSFDGIELQCESSTVPEACPSAHP